MKSDCLYFVRGEKSSYVFFLNIYIRICKYMREYLETKHFNSKKKKKYTPYALQVHFSRT